MKTKIFFTSILIAAVALTSCEKIFEGTLDEVVYSKLTDDLAFSSAENAQAAVNEMYESLHDAFRTPYFYINDMDSDVGYRSGKVFETLNDEGIKTSSENAHFWDGMYKVASRANIVLDQVGKMEESQLEGVSPKAQMIAEAHFMRAFAYYGLSDAYYQVPLVLSSEVNVADPAEFASIDDIEAAIEADLIAAIPDLPKSFPNTEASRPTTGAASAYLCRLYMRQAGRARVAGNASLATEKWNKALEQVNKVLALEGSTYELLPRVFDIYVANTPEGKYNKEIIFAIRATDQVTTGSWDLGLSWTPWDCTYGWSTFSMPLELAWSFQEGDSRFASDMVYTTFTRYNRTDKDKYKYRIYFYPPSIDKVGTMIASYDGDKPLVEGSKENDAVYTRKYEYYEAGTYNYDTPNNAIICRLADMILCKAEILNELNGPSTEAVALLNRIRERAFQGTSHNYTVADFASKDAFRSALCDERAWELHSEGVRRPDLIRMGLWKDRMEKYIAAIKEKAGWLEKNEGREPGYYKSMYVAYPTSLSEKDPLMYMPIPHREQSINPDLANARTF